MREGHAHYRSTHNAELLDQLTPEWTELTEVARHMPVREPERAVGDCCSTASRRKNNLAQSEQTEDESQKSGKTLNFSISPGENL